MLLNILSDKWWAYYFDEYSFSIFLLLTLLIALLGICKSPLTIAIKEWILSCFPSVLKKWDGKERRK
jgi:hypothetical protein